jgi:hypothetical protein
VSTTKAVAEKAAVVDMAAAIEISPESDIPQRSKV